MKAELPEGTQPRTNPGETLRQAREARGWSVPDVAVQLNLTPQRLALLEAGDFDKLPGHTFARGYVRAYAKLLGLDQSRIVIEYDQYTGADSAGSSVHSLGHIEQPVRLSQGVLGIGSFILLLVLLAAAFFWWQDGGPRPAERTGMGPEHIEVEGADGTTQSHPLLEPEDEAVSDARNAGETLPVEVSPELAAEPGESEPGAAAEQPVSASVPSASQSQSPSAPGVAPAPSVAPNTAPVTTAPIASTTPATAPVAAAVAPAAGEGVVDIQFSATCWVQITDANRKVLLSTVKHQGESLRIAGQAPLELRLGVAKAAQVSYNGAAVDVARYTSGETARIKLGQ